MKSADIFSPSHHLVRPMYKILQKVDDATNANVSEFLKHIADIKTCWQHVDVISN